MARPPDPGSGFVRSSADVVWQGRRLAMERATYTSPDGETFSREFTRHPGAVGIIAVDDDGTVTLVRQFRAPMGRSMLEMPAGTCDVAGEDPLETARRELAEEAGLVASTWRRLAPLPVSPGVSDQVTTVYLATGLGTCATEREGPEERAMTLERVPLDAVVALAAGGELIDAPTLAGVALALAALADGDPKRGR
jgi:ADP-ribose pyrophosphatase